MEAEVARLSPRDVPGYRKFLKDSEKRREFGFEGLGMALSFHPLFIGSDPSRVTSMYILVSHLEKEFGVHYAMGGVQAMADVMVRVIEEQGGEVRLNEDIAEIIKEQGRTTGVVTEFSESLTSDIIVSNADPGTTYEHLPSKQTKKRWTPKRLNKSRWSMGLFVRYFGTKGTRDKWADVGHHTILNGPRYKGLLDDIFIKRHLADDMSVYLHRPSVTAPPSPIRRQRRRATTPSTPSRSCQICTVKASMGRR